MYAAVVVNLEVIRRGGFMALNIAELIILSLMVDWMFRKCKIPGLVGMLLVGIVLGPYVLAFLRPDLLSISSDLRMIALIVILLRAGFELSKDTLRRVGMYAILLSFVPAVMEGLAITFLGHRFLHLSYMESAILGAVLSAVSPAVVVPLMIKFIEEKRGTAKGIPTLVLAASSIDDVFVIVIYSVLIGMYTGASMNIAWKLAGIPISVISGIAVGMLCGFGLYKLFDRANPRATKRVLIVLGVSILLVSIEHHIEHFLPFASLLAVMTVGFIILDKNQYMAHEMSAKFGKLWVFAEIILFTLVGAQVNLHVAMKAGLMGSLVIFLALISRSIGTYVCLTGSKFTVPEKFFVVISYIPKATVQAAIGGAPLLAMKLAGMDTRPGEIILAVAVLSILLTAPLGAWGITMFGNRVLKTEGLVSSIGGRVTEDGLLDSFRVEDLMETDISLMRENDDLESVFNYFAEFDFLICPVVDGNNSFVGVITLEYIRSVLNDKGSWKILLAYDVVKPFEHVVQTGDLARTAFDAADISGFKQIPVLEESSGRVVGIFDSRRAGKILEQKLIEMRV